MRRIFTIFLLYALSTISINTVIPHEYSPRSTAFFQCIRSSGYNQLTTWIDSDEEGMDEEYITSIINAKNAGLDVQFLYVPCRRRPAAVQVKFILTKLGINFFDKIWVFPFNTFDDCSWYDYDPDENCEYLQSLIKQFKKYRKTVGIGAGRTNWIGAFKSQLKCPQVSDNQLWWSPQDDQFDQKPNFDSYQQIGGWRIPTMKLFKQVTICGSQMGLTYKKQ